MTQNGKSKVVRKMRTTVPGFICGIKSTSRDNSKTYTVQLHCQLASPEYVPEVKEVLQQNDNIIASTIRYRGNHTSVMFEFKVNVATVPDGQRQTRNVACDVIGSLERRGNCLIDAQPKRVEDERHTRGRRASSRR